MGKSVNHSDCTVERSSLYNRTTSWRKHCRGSTPLRTSVETNYSNGIPPETSLARAAPGWDGAPPVLTWAFFCASVVHCLYGILFFHYFSFFGTGSVFHKATDFSPRCRTTGFLGPPHSHSQLAELLGGFSLLLAVAACPHCGPAHDLSGTQAYTSVGLSLPYVGNIWRLTQSIGQHL
jgi:hypothetical protein